MRKNTSEIRDAINSYIYKAVIVLYRGCIVGILPHKIKIASSIVHFYDTRNSLIVAWAAINLDFRIRTATVVVGVKNNLKSISRGRYAHATP